MLRFIDDSHDLLEEISEQINVIFIRDGNVSSFYDLSINGFLEFIQLSLEPHYVVHANEVSVLSCEPIHPSVHSLHHKVF
jgi:hypothetical protein